MSARLISARASLGLPRALCPTQRLCTLRRVDGSPEDAYFQKLQKEQLAKLKATLAKKKRPMDEADEKVRLQRIIEKVGVRLEIRDELTTALLLWKHDEDLVDSK
jgi:hypothetical protein